MWKRFHFESNMFFDSVEGPSDWERLRAAYPYKTDDDFLNAKEATYGNSLCKRERDAHPNYGFAQEHDGVKRLRDFFEENDMLRLLPGQDAKDAAGNVGFKTTIEKDDEEIFGKRTESGEVDLVAQAKRDRWLLMLQWFPELMDEPNAPSLPSVEVMWNYYRRELPLETLREYDWNCVRFKSWQKARADMAKQRLVEAKQRGEFSEVADLRLELDDEWKAAERLLEAMPDSRDPECVKKWPECESGGYDPRCCRFPKSCSCG
jgi:hypothetical protein